MTQRSLFNTVTQAEEPRKAPSLFEGVTVGMDIFGDEDPGTYGGMDLVIVNMIGVYKAMNYIL